MVPGSYNERIGSFAEDFVPTLKLSDQPDPIFIGSVIQSQIHPVGILRPQKRPSELRQNSAH